MIYRYDLDSFRGIAMLLVFIYHYNKNIMPRGFLGVDIFFLLSGYFITLSNTNKKISIINFYIKRIIRLYPLQVVCIVCVFVKANIVKQVNYLIEMDNLISSLLGYSNYHFYYVSVDYLKSSSSPSDVIHFWSLSIEYQFYIIFPLILYSYEYNVIFSIIYIMFILLCLYESIYFSSYAYFSLSSRLNEFLLGSVISSYKIKYMGLNNILLLFVIIIARTNQSVVDIPFPLPFLLLVEPLISIILINRSDNEYVLNSKILNYLGSLSYSFYLFHYPIITNISTKDSISFIFVFILTLFISLVFTHAIEKPLRKASQYNCIAVTNLIVIILMVIFIDKSKFNYRKYLSSLVYSRGKNISKKYSTIYNSTLNIYYNCLVQSPEDVNYEWECNYYYNQCYCPFLSNNNKHNEEYIYSNIFKQNVLFLIGDSHLEQWSYLIYPYSHEKGYTLLELYSNLDYIKSGDYNWLFAILYKFKNKKYAIISNHIHSYASTSITKYINEILKVFQKVYIIQDTPQFNYDPNNCLIQNKNRNMCYALLGYNATILKFPTIIHTKLHYIDLNEYICENNKCSFVYKGYPVYKDNHHLNMNYTLFLKNEFLKKGFELDNVNDAKTLCNTAIWCRRDYNHQNLNCKRKIQ